MHAVSRTATATLSSRPPARPPSRRARAVVARASSSSDDVVPPLATLGERARNAALTLATSAALVAAPPAAMARLEGVNNPQMLPPGEPVEVLDVAGYLTKGEIARLTSEVRNLEKDTGIRLRVLAQAYPNTPGLAVKDYWKVDDDTVVFVADPGLGNILNFSVGANVDLEVPRRSGPDWRASTGANSTGRKTERRRPSPTPCPPSTRASARTRGSSSARRCRGSWASSPRAGSLERRGSDSRSAANETPSRMSYL